jgi:hypothetical protein
MATKRKKPAKIKKKKVMGKKTASKKPLKKKAARKPATKKKSSPRKKATRKTVAISAKVKRKKKTAAKTKPALKKRSRPKGQRVESPVLQPQETRARAAGQSGALQGLSDIEGADSESVDELLEEGNAFEADVVKGVEEAGDEPEEEVQTHEVLEDDVPEEYLNQDKD